MADILSPSVNPQVGDRVIVATPEAAISGTVVRILTDSGERGGVYEVLRDGARAPWAELGDTLYHLPKR